MQKRLKNTALRHSTCPGNSTHIPFREIFRSRR